MGNANYTGSPIRTNEYRSQIQTNVIPPINTDLNIKYNSSLNTTQTSNISNDEKLGQMLRSSNLQRYPMGAPQGVAQHTFTKSVQPTYEVGLRKQVSTDYENHDRFLS